ncbi:NAD-dependent epimerase/dehydratase family protein [Bryobacter aggregatus]|uniref:NAD-dependent epimerase/dehydratase family protein n=1 Tax=Bryobacter aggregatus TaxID=360054 RepID=UPI0004E0FC8D|nr:NAD-dependent epimerase/dehydratase family protein [Bryobacter aggregatus]
MNPDTSTPEEIELEAQLSTPTAADIEAARQLGGDVVLLGAGGKMGPTLAMRIHRAIEEAGVKHRVIAVLRRDKGELGKGIAVVEADLMDPKAIEALPDAPNLIYLVGRKFGSLGQEHLTWATNSWVSGMCAYRYRESRNVVFSTGNVYPLVDVQSGGATEQTPTGPVGEYAQSALGRERVYEYFATQYQTPTLIFRLNYAIDLRYGVLLDIGSKVFRQEPVDLTTGYVNVIWQGEANSYCLRSLALCSSPAKLLNVTGAETASVRDIAKRFGEIFGREVRFTGEEAPTALLNNASHCHELLGKPELSIEAMIRMQAEWILSGGRRLGIPTKFEKRDGKF